MLPRSQHCSRRRDQTRRRRLSIRNSQHVFPNWLPSRDRNPPSNRRSIRSHSSHRLHRSSRRSRRGISGRAPRGSLARSRRISYRTPNQRHKATQLGPIRTSSGLIDLPRTGISRSQTTSASMESPVSIVPVVIAPGIGLLGSYGAALRLIGRLVKK